MRTSLFFAAKRGHISGYETEFTHTKSWVKQTARVLAEHGDSRVLPPLLKWLRETSWSGSSRGGCSELRNVIDMLEKLLETGAANVSTSNLQLISSLPPVEWDSYDSDAYDELSNGFHTQIRRWNEYENCARLKKLAGMEMSRRAGY